MITTHQLLVMAHLVIFAVWFGSDIATFTLSRRVLDPERPLVARLALAQAMGAIELLARLCLPLMLGSGLMLSIEAGWVDWSRGLIVPIGVVSLAWSTLAWLIHHRNGAAELSSALAIGDLVIRVVVGIGLFVLVVVSSFGTKDPLLGFVAGKALLMAVIITCGITIRVILRPFNAAFQSLVADGSTPATEAALAASVRRAQPVVAVIWICLLGAALVAVTKTLPWIE